MKFNGETIRKAHKFTKMMLRWHKNIKIDYRTQFGIIMSELLNGHEKELIENIAESFNIDTRKWEKYGKSRIYFSRWEGKHNCQYGFWDNNKMEYNTYNKYTVQHNLYDLVV